MNRNTDMYWDIGWRLWIAKLWGRIERIDVYGIEGNYLGTWHNLTVRLYIRQRSPAWKYRYSRTLNVATRTFIVPCETWNLDGGCTS